MELILQCKCGGKLRYNGWASHTIGSLVAAWQTFHAHECYESEGELEYDANAKAATKP